MTATASKDTLRKIHLQKRAAIPAAEHARMSAACCKLLCDAIATRAGKPAVVAGYAPMKNEVDIMGALSALALNYHVTVLPAIKEESMAFHHWKPGDPLEGGLLGTQQPVEGSEQHAPDVVIVPLVTFDRAGFRLGYGAGYYDTAIANLRLRNPFLFAVGVAFSVQEEDALPIEAHDVRLDMIVTEREIILPA